MSLKNEISKWWAENPMTYGKEHGSAAYQEVDGVHAVEFGSREFFERADAEFLSWNRPLHTSAGYFGKIFPYERYEGARVLEIGCGMGCMAMQWAQHGAHVTAIDLNEVSIAQTRERFRIFGLPGSVQSGDANSLLFPDEDFDYVYSWGVLHHSPDLERSIRELFRVLKRGGQFGVMLYNRHSVLHFYNTLYVEGLLHGELNFLNHVQLSSRYGDGSRQEGNPFTWPVTKKEMITLFTPRARDVSIRLLGTELESVLRLGLLGLDCLVPKIVMKAWARRFGWSLWITGTKD